MAFYPILRTTRINQNEYQTHACGQDIMSTQYFASHEQHTLWPLRALHLCTLQDRGHRLRVSYEWSTQAPSEALPLQEAARSLQLSGTPNSL